MSQECVFLTSKISLLALSLILFSLESTCLRNDDTSEDQINNFSTHSCSYSYSGHTEILLSPSSSTACIQSVLFHKDSPNIESINIGMHLFNKDNSSLVSWNGSSLKRIDPHQNSLDKDRINGHYRHLCVEDIYWEGSKCFAD